MTTSDRLNAAALTFAGRAKTIPLVRACWFFRVTKGMTARVRRPIVSAVIEDLSSKAAGTSSGATSKIGLSAAARRSAMPKAPGDELPPFGVGGGRIEFMPQ